MVNQDASGIFHIAGSQVATPYEMAIKICKRLGIPKSRVTPTTMTKFFGMRESKLRLKNAVLNSQKFTEVTGRKTLSLDEGLEKIFIK